MMLELAVALLGPYLRMYFPSKSKAAIQNERGGAFTGIIGFFAYHVIRLIGLSRALKWSLNKALST